MNHRLKTKRNNFKTNLQNAFYNVKKTFLTIFIYANSLNDGNLSQIIASDSLSKIKWQNLTAFKEKQPKFLQHRHFLFSYHYSFITEFRKFA